MMQGNIAPNFLLSTEKAMQFSTVDGYRFSKLTLGTVALGLDYGVSNKSGKPSSETSFEILSAAVDAGINTLDTARSYGDAEHLIGRYLTARMPSVNVVTKFKIKPESLADELKLRDEVYRSVRTSLEQLQLNKVQVCLLHADRHLALDRLARLLPPILEDLQQKGLIGIGGISVDHPREAELVLQHKVFKAVQIPLNIFDLRLIKSGMIDRLADQGKIVFARSIFLQGLFFMSSADLRGTLVNANKYLERLRQLADQADMTIAQLAFSFVRDIAPIASVVFGAVNQVQLNYNVQLLEGKALDSGLTAVIHSAFSEMPEDIITPGLWSL